MRWLIFVSLALAACVSPRPPAPASSAAPIAVRTARAELADVVERFEVGGVVRARLTASVSSRVLAPITAVRVQAGDRVKRGQVLVELDGRDLLAARARAGAALSASQEGVLAADADSRAAASSLTLARSTYARIESLNAKRSATNQELDEAAAALRSAEAREAGARAHADEARAALDAARAGAEAAAITASYSALVAPFDGLVADRTADPGTMASPGVPLVTIEDTGAFRLEARLDEARASWVRPGQTVEISIDNLSGPRIAGSVAEIARVDSDSHSFLVKIDLPRTEGIRSGLFGTARLAGPPRRSVVAPATALIARGQLTFAYRVDDDGTAHLRPVSAASPSGERVEILAGLAPGDQVVIAPPPLLADGSRVRIGALR